MADKDGKTKIRIGEIEFVRVEPNEETSKKLEKARKQVEKELASNDGQMQMLFEIENDLGADIRDELFVVADRHASRYIAFVIKKSRGIIDTDTHLVSGVHHLLFTILKIEKNISFIEIMKEIKEIKGVHSVRVIPFMEYEMIYG